MSNNKELITEYFEKCVRQYNFEDERIALKYRHTYEVAKLCEKIALALRLNEYDVFVAWTIGMLHDIGRFVQLTEYNTYHDMKYADHAKMGVAVIENDAIVKTIFDEAYYRYIISAIYYHNRYEIDADIEGKELMFCQIIRDADKIDICRVIVEEKYENTIGCTYEELINSEVSDDTVNEFIKQIVVSKDYRKTNADQIIGVISYYSGMYFEISRNIMLTNECLSSLLNIEFENKKTYEFIRGVKNKILGSCKAK